MKLYEATRRTRVRIIDEDPKSPPAHRELKKGEELFFDHIDGMYSFCKDEDGNIVHPACWTEVEYIDLEEDTF